MLDETSKAILSKDQLNVFSVRVQKIFEHTAPLMTIPPEFAKKYNLSIWKRFEHSVSETMAMANDIIDIGLRHHHPTQQSLLTQMIAAGMSMDIIKRIFIDLIIAAGDTVR